MANMSRQRREQPKLIDWQHAYTTTTGNDRRYIRDLTLPDGTNIGCLGYLATAYGFVALSYTIHRENPSRLEFGMILDGIYYGRHLTGAFARRTIVTLANKFAKEIAERKL